MKRRLLLVFGLVIVLNSMIYFVTKSTKTYFGFYKNDFIIEEEFDTHGGLLGDGLYYLILDCSEKQETALKKVQDWKPLPLSENLNRMLYGGGSYSYGLAGETHIPKIENGYYLFKDRHSESTDSSDDTALFDRYSFNFSVGIYDTDTDRLYYLAFDTWDTR